MNSLVDISVKQLRRAVVIKQRIAKLETLLADLLNASPARAKAGRGARKTAMVTGRGPGRPKRGTAKRSAAWRARLSAAAKARWKKAKAAGKSTL
jgi:hypothetical protein